MKKLYLIIFLASVLLYFPSCRKDMDKIAKPQWNPQLSFPWIKTGMTLADLLPQDTNLTTGEDNLLKIVYRNDSVFSFHATDFLEIPEQEAEAELIRIDKLSIPDLNSGEDMILWEFVDYLDQETRDSLIANNGAMAIFPEGSLIAPYSSDFDLFENFEEAFISEGILKLALKNDLPVPVNNVQVELINADEGAVIGNFTFDNIGPGATAIDQVDIQEINIGNHVEFSLLSMFTPGSEDPVFVDLDDGIYFDLSAKELSMYSGSGMIEEQDINTQSREINFSLGDSTAWLEKVEFRSAVLNYSFESVMPVDMMLNVRLPGGLKNEEVPSTSVLIPAGTSVDKSWNLDDLVLELNHDNDSNTNSFAVEYDLHVYGSDEIINVDTNCYLSGIIRFEGLKVTEATGYFGQRSFEVEDVELPFSAGIMQNFIQGVELADPVITLFYNSTTGVPLGFNADIKGMTKQGDIHLLEIEPMQIPSPQNPGEEVKGSINIDKENSSIVEFLSHVPETYIIAGSAVTNSTGMQNNFILRESSAVMGVEMDLPLVLQSGNFLFSDTININYSSDQLDKMESAIFKMDVTNGFPFNLEIQLMPLHPETSMPVDTLEFGQLLAATTGKDGKVTEANHSSMSIEIDQQSIAYLKDAKKIIIRAAMNTEGNTNVAALCTDYAVDLKIGLQANVNY